MLSFEMNDRKIQRSARREQQHIRLGFNIFHLGFSSLPCASLEIGIGLTGFGVLFFFLGVIFLFDKGLLAMGNILFLAGVMLTIGMKSTAQFFMKQSHYKGSIAFVVGFFVVLVGWPVIGMIMEVYSFIVLFSGFWPTVLIFLQRIPVLGWLLQQPFLSSLFGYRQRRVPV